MSKVKGNVIDPLDLVHGATFAEMVDKTMPGAPEAEALAKFKKAYPSAAQMGDGFPAFGADAVRFTLATYPPSNKRIALAPKRIEGNRHFFNKIWNATRLALELLGDCRRQPPANAPRREGLLQPLDPLAARRGVRASRTKGIDAFRIDEAAHELYRFFWNDFCDWYLEIVKPRPARGRRPPRIARDARDARVRARGEPAPAAPAHAVHHRGALAASSTDHPARFASLALGSYPSRDDGSAMTPNRPRRRDCSRT